MDLFAGKHLRKPDRVRGVYVDRRPEQNIRARFTYAERDRYRWLTDEQSPSGLMSDGRTHVLMQNGIAVLVTTDGKVSITHRFRNLLNPSSFHLDDWQVGDVERGAIAARDVWVVEARPTMPGKEPTTHSFDQETGIILAMSGGPQFTGFEEIEFDLYIDDETFSWEGPVERRPIGVGYVSEREGAWSVSWQIHFPELAAGYHRKENFGSKHEAVAWTEERAPEVVVRKD